MRIPGGQHLTYCTNVHPARTWPQVQRMLTTEVAAVRKRVCPDEAMGVGLRLGAVATDELVRSGMLPTLADGLAAAGLYVFTLNGFPYGPFHGQPVKASVYAPDWACPERLSYTLRLCDVLAALLPDGMAGSISTVPLGFRPDFAHAPERLQAALQQLLAVVAHLVALQREHGVFIALALEPEPHCALETTDEAIAFFEQHVWRKSTARDLATRIGSNPAEAQRALHAHLGMCLDTCHAAVEFETPQALCAAVRRAGLAVPKMQLSAGLQLQPTTPGALEGLSAFDDPVYLHQTVCRHGEELTRFLDLPEALADAGARGADEWRVHFHVPIFERQLTHFTTTQDFLTELLQLHRMAPITEHLEVETYTWSVLPQALRSDDVVHDIARELTWAQGALSR